MAHPDNKSDSQTAYTAALANLYGRSNQGIKLGLRVMQQLLNALGSPQDAMAHVVVAGTNGKGSTTRHIAGALARGGHRVGRFLSPHLLRFTERIHANGSELGQRQAVALYEAVRAVEHVCERPPTFFECAAAMALLHFAQDRVQVAVLEVGLGGRLDATNVVDKTLAVLTPIAMDHQEFLGNTLTAIATEKAEIIPRCGAVVSAAQTPEAAAVVRKVAHQRGAMLATVRDVRCDDLRLDVTVDDDPGIEGVSLSQFPAEPFRRTNLATAATACMMLDDLGLRCSVDDAAHVALCDPMPGRMQWLPATDNRCGVLLDGAHNEAGLQALLDCLSPKVRPDLAHKGPMHVVFTALRTKQTDAMLDLAASRAATLHLAPTVSKRALSPAALQALADRAGGRTYGNSTGAIEGALEQARRHGGWVLVTGSLFLVADALALLTGESRDPPVDG